MAESVIGSYASAVVEAARSGIREDALRGSFWSGIRVSIAASVLYTFGLIAVLIVLRYARVDLL